MADQVLEYLTEWAESTWGILVDSALFFLIGLFLAGLLKLLLDETKAAKLIGRGKRAVFKASLLGVPLPLCSCSVLPVAGQLRSSGIGKGPTVSFLISTPESSIDSILLTYALTDPLLTVARPVTAFITASIAGLFEDAFVSADKIEVVSQVDMCDSCDCEANISDNRNIFKRLLTSIKYAFTTLLGDLAKYLAFGFILAGAASALLSPYMNDQSISIMSGWSAYLLALVIGLPLYTCASSSTPFAAVMLGAGFPVGAILLFLMVGPATNLATLAVVKKILGLASTVRYLISVVVVSLLCGLLLDYLYQYFDITPVYQSIAAHSQVGWLHEGSAIVLALLIGWHLVKAVMGKTST